MQRERFFDRAGERHRPALAPFALVDPDSAVVEFGAGGADADELRDAQEAYNDAIGRIPSEV